MRVCAICKEDKPLSDFNKDSRGPDGISRFCRSCGNERNRRYRERTPDYWKPAFRGAKDFIIAYKKSKGCERCGYNKTAHALDLHHIDPSTKERSINGLRSREQLKREFAKCIVLCANCHREEHHGII